MEKIKNAYRGLVGKPLHKYKLSNLCEFTVKEILGKLFKRIRDG